MSVDEIYQAFLSTFHVLNYIAIYMEDIIKIIPAMQTKEYDEILYFQPGTESGDQVVA